MGFLNFEFKSKTENDIALTCTGKHNTTANKLVGSFESKFKPANDISLKTKVDSKWVVTSELELVKKLHRYLSHNVIGTVDPESGSKSVVVKNKLKHEHFNAALDMNFKSRFPILTGSLVLPVPQYPAFSLGAQAVIDSQKPTLCKHVYAANYKQNDLEAYVSLTDHSAVDLSVFQKFKEVKLGFRLGWHNDTRESTYGAAVSYKPSPTGKIRMKVDHNCIIGLAYKVKLRPDASVTLSTQIDGKKFDGSDRKYGISFNFG